MASPARLRLMIIERAIEVAASLSRVWREGQQPGPNEHSLMLLELLGELLSGISGSKDPGERQLCNRVSDLYVFLTKHLVSAEDHSDSESIDEIRLVLETEAETWRAVCVQELVNKQSTAASAPTGGLNFSAYNRATQSGPATPLSGTAPPKLPFDR